MFLLWSNCSALNPLHTKDKGAGVYVKPDSSQAGMSNLKEVDSRESLGVDGEVGFGLQNVVP